jgi:hypothetical protein
MEATAAGISQANVAPQLAPAPKPGAIVSRNMDPSPVPRVCWTRAALTLGALAFAGAAALPAVSAAGAAVSAARQPSASRAQVPASLRLSPALWATIDVCNPPDQRFTVGIRGSMPSDGQPHDKMYMRFRLQRLDAASHHWVDVAGASSAYLSMGSAKGGAEAGQSFTLVRPGGAGFILRGVASFQWRHGSRVLDTLSRATKPGHVSQTGADPPKFSAGTCKIA